MSNLYQVLVVLLQIFAVALVVTVLGGLLCVLALAERPRFAERLRARRRRRFIIPLAWIA